MNSSRALLNQFQGSTPFRYTPWIQVSNNSNPPARGQRFNIFHCSQLHSLVSRLEDAAAAAGWWFLVIIIIFARRSSISLFTAASNVHLHMNKFPANNRLSGGWTTGTVLKTKRARCYCARGVLDNRRCLVCRRRRSGWMDRRLRPRSKETLLCPTNSFSFWYWLCATATFVLSHLQVHFTYSTSSLRFWFFVFLLQVNSATDTSSEREYILVQFQNAIQSGIPRCDATEGTSGKTHKASQSTLVEESFSKSRASRIKI